jgi:hypothetical protein
MMDRLSATRCRIPDEASVSPAATLKLTSMTAERIDRLTKPVVR